MRLLNVNTLDQVRVKLADHFGGIAAQIEDVPLDEAVGRHVAAAIVADAAMPGFRRSVVDGYAVRARDTFGSSDSLPAFLNIAGSVEMGRAFERALHAGEAVYVPTGGMIPDGADAVVMIEYIDRLDERTVAVYKPAAPGSGIMNIGDDFEAGARLFEAGHRVTARDTGLLAAAGLAAVPVFRKPVVSIVSTGDELVPISQVPGPGQVRDINSQALGAFIRAAGAETGSIRLLEDDFDTVRDCLSDELARCDILIVSGGSSTGDKDQTAEIIGTLGEPGVFTHGIAIKPGKPTIIGDAGGKPVFGLPGHPVSALIVFKAVVEPFIKHHYFHCDEQPLSVQARITENVHAGEGRETFQLVSLRRSGAILETEPIRAKSGAISQLRKAEGYIRISALTEGIEAGDPAEVILL